jgi:hypothetical protein
VLFWSARRWTQELAPTAQKTLSDYARQKKQNVPQDHARVNDNECEGVRSRRRVSRCERSWKGEVGLAIRLVGVVAGQAGSWRGRLGSHVIFPCQLRQQAASRHAYPKTVRLT